MKKEFETSLADLKILIGCNGGLTGVYLAKRFRLYPNIYLYGSDSSSNSVGRFFVDRQCVLPQVDSTLFLYELIELLHNEDIDIYIPTHSKEVKVISMNERKIRNSVRTQFIVSPIGTFNMLEDKESAYYSMLKAGIPTPRLIIDKPTMYPIIMKQKCGSGSSNLLLIENELVYQAFKQTDSSKVFFEKIDGKEYTVDCIYNKYGELLAYNQRERIKTIGGAVVITRNDVEFDIKPWLEKMTSSFKFCGCVNFQYIVKDNLPFFIDINLRFPSGGLPLTVESGVDIPLMLIKILIGDSVEDDECRSDGKVRTMYRYFEEYFDV